jgi:SAM-dependent methyltransferase
MWNRFIRLFNKNIDNSQKITLEAVTWGYRLFLDREPENPIVVIEKRNNCPTSQVLRQDFTTSREFREKNQYLFAPTLSGNEPSMMIEEIDSEAELQVLFNHIQDTWQYLGEIEPYWSIMTAEQFKLSNISNNMDSFYNAGKPDVERLFHALGRNDIDHAAFKSCLEYGCGLGRIVRWLSERFERVYGYDISQVHLQNAKNYLSGKGIRNVSLEHIQQVQDIERLPKVDLIYSVIVLQHNPPPLIVYMIRNFIRALNPGGVAYFQVPTYRLNYQFCLQEYLSHEATQREMEMHVLPQSKIFDIARTEGGRLVEVLEDGCTGSRYGEVSNTFLIQKE